jgi:hypothetical protein
MSTNDNPFETHEQVGTSLMAFSLVGIGLGAVLTARGFVGEGFLDGPSAVGIGLLTFAVGLSLRRAGAGRR